MNNSNSFEVLGNHEGETLETISHMGKFPKSTVGMHALIQATYQEKTNDLVEGVMWKDSWEIVEDMDIIQQKESIDEVEDMDIDELDLEGIEKACS